MAKNFNIVIAGVGGQGIITLLSIIDKAAFIEGYEVRSSELHGLSQRGGAVGTHIRFGKKVYSPLIGKGEADLIMGLEVSEELRGSIFANDKTIFLVNKNFIPYLNCLSEKDVLENLKKIAKDNLYLVSASEICKDKLQNEVVSGLYLLGYAIYKKLIPLKEESVLKAISDIIPEKYLDLNIRAFQLAKNND